MTGILAILGAITTQDLAPTGASPTANSFVQLPPPPPSGNPADFEGHELGAQNLSGFTPFPPDVTHVVVSVNGTFTGALTANGCSDPEGLFWEPLGDYPFVNENTGVETETIPSGAQGIWWINVVGLTGLRIDAQAAVTGTANVAMNASVSLLTPKGPINPTSTGAQSATLPASSSDQVASANPGRLVSVEILTSGSAATAIYDNASAGSGTLIGEIPASPTVGVIYAFSVNVKNGITVKGAANTSGVVIDFD